MLRNFAGSVIRSALISRTVILSTNSPIATGTSTGSSPPVVEVGSISFLRGTSRPFGPVHSATLHAFSNGWPGQSLGPDTGRKPVIATRMVPPDIIAAELIHQGDHFLPAACRSFSIYKSGRNLLIASRAQHRQTGPQSVVGGRGFSSRTLVQPPSPGGPSLLATAVKPEGK